MDFHDFFERVRLIKREFDILPVKQNNDRYRRRIALLIIDEFLKSGGDIHQAFFLEADLYRQLRKVSLRCNPTSEEVRMCEVGRGRRQKLRGFNPLKLVSENADLPYKKPYPLTREIIKLLTDKKEDTDGFPGDNIRRRAPQTFKYLQKDTRLFKKQKGASLYRAD